MSGRVPLDLTPEEADELLPLGSVIPFKEGEVPFNWEPFEGQQLHARDYPDLYERLETVPEIWEQMGGSLTSDGIILPGPFEWEESNRLVWGRTFKNPVPMTLAIKVRRDVRD